MQIYTLLNYFKNILTFKLLYIGFKKLFNDFIDISRGWMENFEIGNQVQAFKNHQY